MPGATKYYSADNVNALSGSLESIASRVAICRFELSEPPPAGSTTVVSVGGVNLPRDTTRFNGWDFIDSDSIEVFGASCDSLVNTPADVVIETCF